MARSLTEAQRQQRVDGEWSLVETLRHLVFVTDAWFGRCVLDRADPYHPLGLAPTFLDGAPFGLDATATPSFADVLAVRAGRTAEVERFLAVVGERELDAPAPSPRRCRLPAGVRAHDRLVRRCGAGRGWHHHQYAMRDLASITACDADGSRCDASRAHRQAARGGAFAARRRGDVGYAPIAAVGGPRPCSTATLRSAVHELDSGAGAVTLVHELRRSSRDVGRRSRRSAGRRAPRVTRTSSGTSTSVGAATTSGQVMAPASPATARDLRHQAAERRGRPRSAHGAAAHGSRRRRSVGDVELRVGCAMWAYKAWQGRQLPERRPATSSSPRTRRGATPSRATRRSTACRRRRPSRPGRRRCPTGSASSSSCRGRSPTSGGCAARTTRCAFLELLAPLGQRAETISVQLPASFGPPDLGALATFVRRLSTVEPHGHRFAVEVRHPAFFDRRRSPAARCSGSSPTKAPSGSRSTRRRCSHARRRPRSSVRRGSRSHGCRSIATPLTDQPVVRIIGRDDPRGDGRRLAGLDPRRRPWLGEGRTPTVFVHTPDNVDALVLARLFHDQVRAVVPDARPAADAGRDHAGDVVLNAVSARRPRPRRAPRPRRPCSRSRPARRRCRHRAPAPDRAAGCRRR